VSVLLVCSVGGHLAELNNLLPRMLGPEAGERTWVTFDTPQSRATLRGERVVYLDYTGPRDVKNVLRHAHAARRLLAADRSLETIISTGAGIALSFLPLGRLYGAACHYIESFTRTAGPSLTGRLLARVPGVSLYTQHPAWADERWRYSGSVLDAFALAAPAEREPALRRAVVTLGTMEDYSFGRLVRRAHELLPPETEVLWQVGCTDASDLPIESHRAIPGDELTAAMRAADVVIAHAGCGSAISALEAGKTPLLVPRSEAHGENVDGHQRMLARELAGRGLAVVRELEQLKFDDLLIAARGVVAETACATGFALTGSPTA
jgi:UDP-N-acetylglucosamine--N-acetylmuramyl-(pentapeptide) pyrophosphoryl-undecaprenol N-acetylglucosamine transferase